jgi:hypothetical protein
LAARKNGGGLTDEQCDAIIEELGPDVVMDTLRQSYGDTPLH